VGSLCDAVRGVVGRVETPTLMVASRGEDKSGATYHQLQDQPERNMQCA
jgi:hypothetical protein